MIELAFFVILVLLLVIPTVLYQTLSAEGERTFRVVRDIEMGAGPYRGHQAQVAEPFVLPVQARGAIALSFLFAVMGLLLTMPVMLGVMSQWAGAWVVGLPSLALAMAATVAGIRLLRQGPGAAPVAWGAGLAQLLFGGWLLAVVMTVTDAQFGPVSGWEEGVAQALHALGSQPRGAHWTLPFAVDSGFGLLPVLYGTASVLHGVLLVGTARSFSGVRLATAERG
jgi:hypothetical protein